MENGIIDIVVACADSTLIIVLSIYISKHFPKIASVFENFGKLTLVMLCLHNIEFKLFPWKEVNAFIYTFVQNDAWCETIIALLSYILILALAYFISKIPVLRKIYNIH